MGLASKFAAAQILGPQRPLPGFQPPVAAPFQQPPAGQQPPYAQQQPPGPVPYAQQQQQPAQYPQQQQQPAQYPQQQQQEQQPAQYPQQQQQQQPAQYLQQQQQQPAQYPQQQQQQQPAQYPQQQQQQPAQYPQQQQQQQQPAQYPQQQQHPAQYSQQPGQQRYPGYPPQQQQTYGQHESQTTYPQQQQQNGQYHQQYPPPVEPFGSTSQGVPAGRTFATDPALIFNILKETVVEKNLHSFYPDPTLHSLASRIGQTDPVTTICKSWNIPLEIGFDLVKLSLYDIVFLIDDSGSIEYSKLQGELKAILKSTAYASSLFDQDGFSVRFMNSTVEADHVRTGAQAEDLVSRVSFRGATPLVRSLETKILQKPRDPQKPLLVIIITDGIPTDNINREFEKMIGSHKNEHVAFQIAQVGNDDDAQAFLASLDSDAEIGNLIDCTSNFEMESSEFGKTTGAQLTRELWYTKLLLGSIDKSYDKRDERQVAAGPEYVQQNQQRDQPHYLLQSANSQQGYQQPTGQYSDQYQPLHQPGAPHYAQAQQLQPYQQPQYQQAIPQSPQPQYQQAIPQSPQPRAYPQQEWQQSKPRATRVWPFSLSGR